MKGVRSKSRSFRIDAALSFAIKTFLKDFWFLVLVHTVIGGTTTLLASLIWRSEPGHHILTTAFGFAYVGGLVTILLSLADGGKPRLADLFSKWQLFWPFLVAYICAYVLWGLGVLALVVPGVIAMLHTCFYALVITEDECGPIDAFRRSSLLTKGCRWKLLGFFCVLLALAVPIGLITGLVLGIPAVVLHLHFHVGVRALVVVGMAICFASVRIFWELAWVHCYRQLTVNTTHSPGSLEYAKAKLKVADDRCVIAECRLELALSNLYKQTATVSALRASLSDRNADSLVGSLTLFQGLGKEMHGWTGAEIREMELLALPIAKLELIGTQLKHVAETYLLLKPYDSTLTFERWIPHTIETGTIEWTVDHVNNMAGNVKYLAIRLEALNKKVDQLAERLRITVRNENWQPATWSDAKVKTVWKRTEWIANGAAHLAGEVENYMHALGLLRLQIGSMPHQLKWATLTEEERDKVLAD